jgi:hypothetical protein
MNTDKYHQGEREKCKEKAYLQHKGRSTSPQSTQDRDDQEYEEGNQDYEDSQRSTYDNDQDCQEDMMMRATISTIKSTRK